MNKLIIICGGDRLGKGTLIKGLCDYYDYKNITVRHCDKPPKNLSQNESLDFQFKCFNEEFNLISYIEHINRKFIYHDNIIIYDRFYPGEYVYGQMFRNQNSEILKQKILALEQKYIKNNFLIDICLITLTADPEFFLSKEDGQSFSKNLKQKSKELKLFEEVHNLSLIHNKLFLKVDEEDRNFRNKQEILEDVTEWLDKLNF